MNKNYKRRTPKLKNTVSQLIFIFVDILCIYIALFVSLSLHTWHNNLDFNLIYISYSVLSNFPTFAGIVLLVFIYESIYINRYDFWQESKIIIKALVMSLVILNAYAYLILKDNLNDTTILFAFLILFVLIPFMKYITKKKMFSLGYWKKGVKLLSSNKNLQDSLLNDPYLGYINSQRKEADVVLIDSSSYNEKTLKSILNLEIQIRDKVIFLPLVNNYQFSPSDIFELTDRGSNLIFIQNRLKSSYRLFINKVYNIILSIIAVPLLLPIIAILGWIIKRDSNGPVFFTQKRITQGGKSFVVYKFRTMYIQAEQEKILEEYLHKNPQERDYYVKYAKYRNDPRITKFGHFLRKTSLDELAQIVNVVKGEMNFIGPRPYMVSEREKMTEEEFKIIHTVKPGITGLWQVSGRNNLTFEERVRLEKWYVLNWSLWKDFVIFNKTFGVLLKKTGAR